MASLFEFPLQFNRQYKESLDYTDVVGSLAELDTYRLTNPIAYPGQIVAISGTNQVYLINNDLSLTQLGAASAINAIEGQFLPLSGGYVYNTLNAELLSSYGGTSTKWNSNYNTTALLSAQWNSVHNYVAGVSARQESLFNTVAPVSANWNSVHSTVAEASARWNSVHSTVAAASARWNSVHNYVAGVSAMNESLFNTVAPVSANWNSVHATVAATSARYESLFNTVAPVSANWNSVHSTVATASARWNSVHNSVATTSGSWNQAYNASTVYNTNSALYTQITFTDATYFPLTGGTITGNVNLEGNLYVTGTATYVNVQDVIVRDPIIYLAADNTSDVLDTGFMVSWTEGALGYQHGGLIRRADTNEWTLFGGLTSEPLSADGNPDWTEAGLYQMLLNADLRGTVYGNLTGSARDANILTTARVISAKKDIDFSVTFNGSQNVTSDATIANHAVTYDKIQEVNTDRLLGRQTAGKGDVEEITCTAQARALLDDATAADQATTIGVGTTNTVTFSGITLGSPAIANSRVFTKTTGSTTNVLNVPTFPKQGFTTIKYTAQIVKDTSRVAALEILAVSGTSGWDGTVYAIVDPGNIFTNVDVSNLNSTIDLDFTFNGNATYNVTVYGNALRL